MKIVTIVGARPQFVKAAMVSRAIRDHNKAGGPPTPINEVILHTGQHFEWNMSRVFFDELEIPKPNYNLGINSGSHGLMTGRMVEKIEAVLKEVKPDWVLVYGDTNTTLAGTLAAKKIHLNIAHIEAGLRSFNIRMPEEQNRLVTDRLSDLLLCPTETAVINLKKEGIGNSPYGEKVINVGDVMYDALLYYSDIAEQKSSILEKLSIKPLEYVIATIHRAENTDVFARLENIILALGNIGKKTAVILPLHPRTRKILSERKSLLSNIKIIDPVSYLDMIMLEKNCQAIITDSGGVQKEAYFFHRPCITVRNETEWVELVNANVNFLAGASKKRIVKTFNFLQNAKLDFSYEFYGNGKAGEKIIKFLCNDQGIRQHL